MSSLQNIPDSAHPGSSQESQQRGASRSLLAPAQPSPFSNRQSSARQTASHQVVSSQHQADDEPQPGYRDVYSHPVAVAYAAAHSRRTIPKFGPYLLFQTVGEGRFGKVKLGLHRQWGDEVAVKLIRQGNIDGAVQLSKAEREIEVLRTLKHPNIVQLYDVIETDKYIGIILEYASGGELFDHIMAHRYLKEKDAAKLFSQLISGVWYIHQKKIVHRDLKLENLLLDRNRNVIITDFGFANRFEHRADDLMQTNCGSPCYAAPELVISEGLYVSPTVDIWSCGIILYAMLAGYLPFDDDPNNPDGDDINLLYKYIVNTPLSFPDYVSAEARDLLSMMLVPDPTLRADSRLIMAHSWLSAYAHIFSNGVENLECAAMEQHQTKRLANQKQMRQVAGAQSGPSRVPRSSYETSTPVTTMDPDDDPFALSSTVNIPVTTSLPDQGPSVSPNIQEIDTLYPNQVQSVGDPHKQAERLGDRAMDDQQYGEAISHYSTALSLVSSSPQAILVKRSKAQLATGSWKQALDGANQVIKLDPSSPWGYEMKHAALHKAGEYHNAVDAFEAMLSKIAQSSDPDVQRRGDHYISPSSTRATIRTIVRRTIRDLPRVLINATTGRLYNKADQESAFESLPIFYELVSSITTRIDYVRIKHEVRQYFRYVAFSHKWEDNEPLFEHVIHIAVYDLGESPTHNKLQTFCKIVRDAGFHWAWSDTCCINKSDHFVLQEALVAMFKWYQGSAMMIVFLRGVRSSSRRGALVKSIWNTRGWTLQEYVASKIIRFYTEDWTPYLDLELPNHKESPEVMSEMEQATGVSAQQLMALRPGLTSIREKLRLASTRETTLVEDAAYSLLGIFSVTGIPAIYGEGEGSLGRLLAHALTGSGDASILAWTGESGSFNSCLPAHITVFNRPTTLHLPSPVPGAEVESGIVVSRRSFYFNMAKRLYSRLKFDVDIALKLYDCLNELPAPWFAASRMKLPCIAFQLPPLTPHRTRSGHVYRVDTAVFGMVEIKTRQDLSRMNSLYVIHPWLDALLGREETHSGEFVEDDVAPPLSPNADDEENFDKNLDERSDDGSSLSPEPGLLSHPIQTTQVDKVTQVQRLVARLRQPFGALLLTLASAGGRAVDYRRVAADSLITVQFQESASLSDILNNVRTLDVL